MGYKFPFQHIVMKTYTLLYLTTRMLVFGKIREGASHSLCRDGTVNSDCWVFEIPEAHIRHVQNLILIAGMESAS